MWTSYGACGFGSSARCFVCDRLMALHSPWARYICERTPLPIEITAKGYALLAAESVVPVSMHAEKSA